jgi:EAL domain-containing protein (putative c-di-GMP-specific phosphodiesterase class I)
MLERAFLDALSWPRLVTTVPVSPAQFRISGFVAETVALARRIGVAPGAIELSIKESLLLEDIEAAADQISRLKEAGFRVALDDFGVSYSSFAYLRRIPFDRLTIDRSFIDNLTHSAGAAAVVQSIVQLGHALGLTVSAEGVEEPDQKALLSALGCSHVQGRLFYGPMAKAEILALEDQGAELKAAS